MYAIVTAWMRTRRSSSSCRWVGDWIGSAATDINDRRTTLGRTQHRQVSQRFAGTPQHPRMAHTVDPISNECTPSGSHVPQVCTLTHVPTPFACPRSPVVFSSVSSYEWRKSAANSILDAQWDARANRARRSRDPGGVDAAALCLSSALSDPRLASTRIAGTASPLAVPDQGVATWSSVTMPSYAEAESGVRAHEE